MKISHLFFSAGLIWQCSYKLKLFNTGKVRNARPLPCQKGHSTHCGGGVGGGGGWITNLWWVLFQTSFCTRTSALPLAQPFRKLLLSAKQGTSFLSPSIYFPCDLFKFARGSVLPCPVPSSFLSRASQLFSRGRLALNDTLWQAGVFS